MPDSSRRRRQARLARQLVYARDPAKAPWKRKRAARYAACLAEHLGLIRRPRACQACGSTAPLTRHHPDHDEPLAIEWLCDPCHREADTPVPDFPRNPLARPVP